MQDANVAQVVADPQEEQMASRDGVMYVRPQAILLPCGLAKIGLRPVLQIA